jgi:uncharacterized protein (TIGR03067 family)
MATSTSFKQQCPSCEAMVPIRDPGLIGRKIDCPKCKYRFVVERPDVDEDEADEKPAKKGKADKGITDKPAAKAKAGAVKAGVAKAGAKGAAAKVGKGGPRRRDEEDERPVKKKGGSSMVVILGGGLAVIALVVLVIGGLSLAGIIPLFGGDEKKPSARGGGGTPTPTPSGDPNEGKGPPPPPAVAADITNLLPNDAQAVVSIPMTRVAASSLRAAALQTDGGGGYSETKFERTFDGLKLFGDEKENGISRVLMALNHQKNWVFTVVRTTKDLDEAKLKKGLRVGPANNVKVQDKEGKRTGRERPYHLIQADLDSLSNLLLKGNQRREPFAVCFLDRQTLVFADVAPMRDFLAADASPKHLSKPPAPPPPTTPPAGGDLKTGGPGGPDKGKGPVTPTGPDKGKGPSGDKGKGPKEGGGAPPPPEPPPASYMSVKPALKELLDKIEQREQGKVEPTAVLTYAAEAPVVRPWLAAGPVPGPFRALLPGLQSDARKAEVVGFSLGALDSRALSLVVAAGMDGAAADATEKRLRTDLQQVVSLIDLALGVKIGLTTPPPGAKGPKDGGLGTPPGRPVPLDPKGAPPEEKADDKRGTIGVSVKEKTVIVSLEMQLAEGGPRVVRFLEGLVVELKAQSDLASSRSRVHDLAAALQAYVAAKGHFPRGTMPRPPNAERGIDWYPDQRLSWMVELLPSFGEEYAAWRANPELSWDEGVNRDLARRLMPYYVEVLQANPAPIYIRYPGKDGAFAATHWVGVAGVGMNAPKYAADNPKRGIFGYDRATRKDEVRDGLDKTIALLQVPGEHKAPWMAGGGSTVRGVSEDSDTVDPFVCMTFVSRSPATARFNNKPGTRAIMADGKVRFIPADINPDTFRALCTVAGGENVDNLDAIAPVIERDDGPPPVGPSDPRPGPGPIAGLGPDLQKLQGTWSVVRVEVGGAKLPPALVSKARWTVTGNRAVMQMAGATEKEEIILNSSKSPKTIDLVGLEGLDRGKTQRGIYELSGDDLKVCLTESPAAPRPAAFETKKGDNNQLVVFKRGEVKAPSPGPKGPLVWKAYTSKAGGYTVDFPSDSVITTSQELNAPAGKLTLNVALVGVGEGGLCGVTYADLPPAALAGGADAFFANAKAGVTLSFGAGAKVTAEKNITINGSPGRQWDSEGPAQSVQVRAYLVGSRMYQLTAGGTKGALGSADQQRFFDSFRLLPGGPPKAPGPGVGPPKQPPPPKPPRKPKKG